MCSNIKLVVVACDESATEVFACYIANLFYAFHIFYFGMIADRNGEEEFVVFAAIECAGGYIEVELFSSYGCLIVDRDVLLIDAATALALVTDMQEFAA